VTAGGLVAVLAVADLSEGADCFERREEPANMRIYGGKGRRRAGNLEQYVSIQIHERAQSSAVTVADEHAACMLDDAE